MSDWYIHYTYITKNTNSYFMRKVRTFLFTLVISALYFGSSLVLNLFQFQITFITTEKTFLLMETGIWHFMFRWITPTYSTNYVIILFECQSFFGSHPTLTNKQALFHVFMVNTSFVFSHANVLCEYIT